MNAIGIIAEYNPLHNGHVYQMEEAVRLAGSDAVAVAMSGDCVQRGEPAILDKWERSRLAVQCGADVVIEIPSFYCLSDAGGYAAAGTCILEALGCVTHLSFGSESGDAASLKLAASNLDEHNAEIDEKIKDLRESGMPYPAARAAAYKEICRGMPPLPDEPNDILAVEYIRSCEYMQPLPVKRQGAGYNDTNPDDGVFLSAAGVREKLMAGDAVNSFVPSETAEALAGGILTFSDEWLDYLKYAVLSASAEEIDRCPSGGEGIGNRLKDKIAGAETWDGFILSVKTRRYTYTRLSRLCMQIIMGIDREIYSSCRPSYLRILALSSKGRELISEIKKNDLCTLPVITNINKESQQLDEGGRRLLDLDIHTSDIYNLVTGRNMESNSDYRMMPYIE